jgi:outer membrane immunogenic protein
MKKLLFAGIAGMAALATGSADAADLGRPTYKAPPPMVAPAPVALWTGCYVGANIGGAWAHKNFHFGTEDEGSDTPGGFAGGGQIGCDYQFGYGKGAGGPGGWVIGIQGMFDGTTISGTDIDPTRDGDSYSTKVHWFSTLTGRLGFLVTPALLLYGKGGVAWVNETHDYFVDGALTSTAGSFTRTGWDAGVGLEWMFAPNWSVWVEYDHMGFGARDVRFTDIGCCGGFTEHITQSVDKVLVGINWRFGLGKGKAPVVAKY